MDRRLVAGMTISLLVHAGLFAFSPSIPGKTLASLDQPVETPDESALGVARSDVMTMTWLGFEDPTPHEAQKARIEQAELVLGGSPETHDVPIPEDHASPPLPDDQPNEHNESLSEVQGESDKIQTSSENIPDSREIPIVVESQDSPWALLRDLIAPVLGMSPPDSPQHAAPEVVPESPPAISPVQESPSINEPAPVAQPPTPPPARTPAPTFGRDQAEAPGTSRHTPLQVKPGQPAAVQGRLRIDPRVPPEFRAPARVLSAPRSAIFQIDFAKDGSVGRVTLVRSSGSSRVDEPWQAAIYNWRGEGPALEALPQDDPNARYSVFITLLPP
ncbi:MAG: hypothetical protein KF866_11950 [Phycisphaeraceae bacterium]|nr:hypothetical protein [Phycisphaeraceae bacterium]MCW5755248.1 hypothetical protein [Phycisphaeraceae bacterium]